MDHVLPVDVDTFSRIRPSPPRDTPALDESLVSSFQMQSERCRQPVVVDGRPWSITLPSGLMAPPTHDGHGGDKSGGGDGDIGRSGNPSYGGGRRGSSGRQQKRREGTTCGLCETRETPQWRSGPDGPGTLCNSCGIRYRMAGDKYVTEHGHRRFPMTACFGREVPLSRGKATLKDEASVQLTPNAAEVPRP